MNTGTITIELPEVYAARIEARDGENSAQKVESDIAEYLAAEAFEEANPPVALSPQQTVPVQNLRIYCGRQNRPFSD
jgi:hypothetical protein